MTKTESFKFMIRVDVRYLSDPPRADYSPPNLDQVEKAVMEKLKELEVDGWPVDTFVLAKTQVRKED